MFAAILVWRPPAGAGGVGGPACFSRDFSRLWFTGSALRLAASWAAAAAATAAAATLLAALTVAAPGDADPTADAIVPSALTISCFVSDERVPGPVLVRLIFILRPGSTVAECCTVDGMLPAAAADILGVLTPALPGDP